MHSSMDMHGVTHDDVSKLTKAMKDQQFRDHMDEYVREISDPKHRKEYLDYLDQVEAKGEMPDGQQLLRCEPGLCVKTTILFKNGQTQKCFINVVHSDRLDDFSTIPDKGGQRIHVPHVLSPPRPDQDRKSGPCMTCDLAVSTRTFLQAAQHSEILKLLVDTAADGLGTHFLKGFEEVKKDYKVMQRLRCKGGPPMPMSVKAERLKDGGKKSKPVKKPSKDAVTPGELRKMRSEAKQQMKHQEDEEEEDLEREEEQEAKKKQKEEVVSNRIRVPKHSVVHSGTVDLSDFMEASGRPSLLTNITVPKLLRLTVELPTVKQVGDIQLEVTARNVVVEVENKFYLDLPLSYEIDDANGSAKFDKNKQVLTLELPVCPKPPSPETLAALQRLQADASEPAEPIPNSHLELPDTLEEDDETQDVAVVEPVDEEDDDEEEEEEKRQDDESEAKEQNQEKQADAKGEAREEATEEEVEDTRYVSEVEETSKNASPSAEEGLSSDVMKSAASQEEAAWVRQADASCPMHLLQEECLDDVVEWRQTRQNLLLLITLPAGLDKRVAGVRLGVADRRITVAFLTPSPCPSSSSSSSHAAQDAKDCAETGAAWQYHRVRRCFCRDGAIDTRQWHAEVLGTRGQGRSYLLVTVRKTDQEIWDEAFDHTATLPPAAEDWLLAPSTLTSRGAEHSASRGDEDAFASQSGAGVVVVEQEGRQDEGGPAGEAKQALSSRPEVRGGGAADAASLQGAGADALKQSAIGMGQSVLLRSRLMYQLL